MNFPLIRSGQDKKVSIIVPSYNSEPFIRHTIESLLEQTYQNTEIIIVDDGSTDDSWNIIQSYGSRIRGIRQENRGGCNARNTGARVAKGYYLMFMDADDLIEPSTLQYLVATLEYHEDSVSACTWRRLVKEGDDWVKVSSRVPVNPPDGDYIRGWLTGWYFPPCSILWPRDVYDRIGGWDEQLTANQDGDLMLRALLEGVRIVVSPGGEAYYRNHSSSRLSVSSDITSENALRSRMRVLEKVTGKLRELEKLEQYKEPLGIAYHKLARNNFGTNKDLAGECVRRAETFIDWRATPGTRTHRILCMLLGLERKEKLAVLISKIGIMKSQRRQSHRLRDLQIDIVQ